MSVKGDWDRTKDKEKYRNNFDKIDFSSLRKNKEDKPKEKAKSK